MPDSKSTPAASQAAAYASGLASAPWPEEQTRFDVPTQLG